MNATALFYEPDFDRLPRVFGYVRRARDSAATCGAA